MVPGKEDICIQGERLDDWDDRRGHWLWDRAVRYFLTDELDQVPDEPVGGETAGAHKDLAFLGSIIVFFTLGVRKLTYHLGGQLYAQEVRRFFERFLISWSV